MNKRVPVRVVVCSFLVLGALSCTGWADQSTSTPGPADSDVRTMNEAVEAKMDAEKPAVFRYLTEEARKNQAGLGSDKIFRKTLPIFLLDVFLIGLILQRGWARR